MNVQQLPKLLTSGEAARLVGVSPDTLRRWAKSGRVRHVVTPSRRILFDPADIEAVYRTVDPDSESSVPDVPLPGLGRAGR